MTEQEDLYSDKHQCLGDEQNSLGHLEILSASSVSFLCFVFLPSGSFCLALLFFLLFSSFYMIRVCRSLVFPRIPFKILLASGRQKVAGVMTAMKQPIESSLLFKSFWEMQTIWGCISGFCPWNFLSPREAELGSKACKDNSQRFCFCFVESASWMEPGDCEVPGEQGSSSMRSEIFRKLSLQGKPPQQGLQLVFAISHETEMYPKPDFLISGFFFIYWYHHLYCL